MSAQGQGEVEVLLQPICNLSARGGSGWSAPCPSCLTVTHWKDLVPTVHKAGWSLGLVWTGMENMLPPPGFDPQPIASCCTDCTILATSITIEH